MVYPHITYLGPAYSVGPKQIATMRRELDSRTSDGIHVGLLWDPQNDGVTVVVNDTKTGDAFELPVPDRQHALEAFHHPYGYATTLRAADTQRLASTRALQVTHPAS
jgi:hypothetical protein